MKIALICGRDIRRTEDTDGGSVLVRNLASELSRRGHAVDIFVPQNTIGGIAHERSYTDEARDGFTLIRFPVDLGGLDLGKGSRDPQTYFMNRIAISEREADFFGDGSLYAYERVYIVHLAHAFGLMERGLVPPERTVVFPMMLGAFYRMFDSVPEAYMDAERKALREARHVATVSDAERAVLTGSYEVPPERIFKVGRGYDDAAFTRHVRERLPDGRIDILCANVIKPQKDQNFFLDLLEAARERGIDLRVHLVGVRGKTHRDGYNRYAAQLEEEIAARGLSGALTFADVLPQDELSAFMERCAVAVYPSRTETFGKSALESMATGLPTIVFDDVPAFGEFIDDRRTGRVVPRSADAVIDALLEFRDDPGLYRTLSEGGIERGRSLTWAAVIGRMLNDEAGRMEGA